MDSPAPGAPSASEQFKDPDRPITTLLRCVATDSN